MTEIEAHRMSTEIVDQLSPPVRAILVQRLDQGKLSIFEFLGLTVDGIPFDDDESESESGDFVLKYNAQETADLITKILGVTIGEPSWTLAKYVGRLISVGMDAHRNGEITELIEFPKQ